VIPAILAVPIVQGVVGSVVGQVMNCFGPSTSTPTAPAPTTSTSFGPYLNRATAPQISPSTFSTGTMRANQWNQMGSADMSSWMKGLQGLHVDATSDNGRTISGVVSGVQQSGNNLALNIGGHLVSLSQLKQITWSPSV
jgi:hypothetical protein